MVISLGALAAEDLAAPLARPPAAGARRSTHFRLVSAAGPLPDRLEREALQALEKAYRRFLVLFEAEPATPIDIRFHPTPLFHGQTGAPPWADGMFERDGHIRVAVGGMSRLEPPLERTLVHELAHAFITTRSGGRSPRWLQEGLAQMLAGSPLPARFRAPEDGPDGLDYGGCLVFTRMLREHLGTEVLVDVLQALADGAAVEDAFAAEAGSPLGRIYETWRLRVVEDRPHPAGGESE